MQTRPRNSRVRLVYFLVSRAGILACLVVLMWIYMLNWGPGQAIYVDVVISNRSSDTVRVTADEPSPSEILVQPHTEVSYSFFAGTHDNALSNSLRVHRADQTYTFTGGQLFAHSHIIVDAEQAFILRE